MMEPPTRNKFTLETPCLVLDLDILERNLGVMQSLADKKGKRLRPHAKTHKCTRLAKKQIESGAAGICAAKISEAERLAEAGIENILVTGPFISPVSLKRIVDTIRMCPSLMVALDNAQVVSELNNQLQVNGLTLDVLLDIDVGLRRTGTKPADVLSLARHILAQSSLKLRGIQAYAGHLQHITSYKERKVSSRASLEGVVPIFEKLHSEVEGFTIFSASGTGTFEMDSDIPEVTEHQVGSYVCMDAEYLAVESSEGSKGFTALEPALRLMTTVVSANQSGFVTVDAGLKTLYKDGAVPRVITPQYSGTTYDWFGDEYGKISYGVDSEAPPLGTVLELITSHCDPTINLFDRFYITKGEEVVDEWPIDLRGCSQ